MATEQRLIDVCAEIRKIEDVLAERKEQAGSFVYKVFEEVKTALEKAPTVDAVPVVRCRDCKWWHDMKCTNINGANCLVMNENWFCCSGERKDNA